jgi:hypothetical protein
MQWNVYDEHNNWIGVFRGFSEEDAIERANAMGYDSAVRAEAREEAPLGKSV